MGGGRGEKLAIVSAATGGSEGVGAVVNGLGCPEATGAGGRRWGHGAMNGGDQQGCEGWSG